MPEEKKGKSEVVTDSCRFWLALILFCQNAKFSFMAKF